MKFVLAAVLVSLAAVLGPTAATAQDAPQLDPSALGSIMARELTPETEELAMKLVQLSGTGRTYDELLPMIADQAKNAFIRANPQMQLGIIDVVDRVAITLVSRRPQLDKFLARVWATAFTDDEMEELVEFYESDVGQKFAGSMPEILGVQTAAAQKWGEAVGSELTQKVSDELRSSMSAEERALQGDVAGPEETPAPAPQ